MAVRIVPHGDECCTPFELGCKLRVETCLTAVMRDLQEAVRLTSCNLPNHIRTRVSGHECVRLALVGDLKDHAGVVLWGCIRGRGANASFGERALFIFFDKYLCPRIFQSLWRRIQ